MPHPTEKLFANFSQAISQNQNFKCKYYASLCVCVCVCVWFDLPQVLDVRRIPVGRLGGCQRVQGLKRWATLGHQDPPVRCYALVTSNTCSSSVWQSSPACWEAQTERDRALPFPPVWGIEMGMSGVTRGQSGTAVPVGSPWLFFERYYCPMREF